MFKKISYLLFASAILITGCIAINKLNYWERSVRIFSIKNQNFEGRRGRGQFGIEGFSEREGRSGFERSGIGEIPDSIRAKITTAGRRQITRDRDTSDSLIQQSGRNNRELRGRDSFESGTRNGRDRGRSNSPRGRKIYFSNVLWFLAVFASFTVLTIYVDKGYINLWKNRFK